MMFKEGPVEGVEVRRIEKYSDERGWLIELFRDDELSEKLTPQMSYLSMTKPGVARGPHEHIDQIDYFCFTGPSNFKVYFWDNRENSSTYQNRMTIVAGAKSPSVVIVPTQIVHAYKNIGDEDGLVINCPNRLFMGEGRKEPVDEVRHEDNARSPYIID